MRNKLRLPIFLFFLLLFIGLPVYELFFKDNAKRSLNAAVTNIFNGTGCDKAVDYDSSTIPHKVVFVRRIPSGQFSDRDEYGNLFTRGMPLSEKEWSRLFTQRIEEMQLVLTEDSTEHIPTGETRQYQLVRNSVPIGTRKLPLYHTKGHYSLRKARTAEVIASITIEGNEKYPDTVSSEATEVYDGFYVGPPLLSWL